MDVKIELKKIKEIKGVIEVITGLHIGASNDSIEIGGMDNPIIRNPLTGEPYIPGSSIKGKMRSIMEWVTGKVAGNNGEPCSCGKCEICRVFGVSASTKDVENAKKRGPTRLIVRDAFLMSQWKKKFNGEEGSIIEEKSENSINRITAMATPRPLERVVPGVEFVFNISYLIFDMGDNGRTDEEYFNSVVLRGLAYLEKSYLGGGGSRGNGKIKFKNLKDENGNEIKLPHV